MSTRLVDIRMVSIYERKGRRVLLPSRMARCTPDTKQAILKVKLEVEAVGGALYLSDLFRSYDMQLQAHLDFKSGKKKAYSPPPGGSMHEAGRALDLDLRALDMPLGAFWTIAAKHGLTPIIASPDPKAKEAWHFDCRGSHTLIYAYYSQNKGTNFSSPYRAMATSAIVSAGIKVDQLRGKEEAAYIQSGLIRLGHEIGNIDGDIGPRTRRALTEVHLDGGAMADVTTAIDLLLQEKFPAEFFDRTPAEEDDLFDSDGRFASALGDQPVLALQG